MLRAINLNLKLWQVRFYSCLNAINCYHFKKNLTVSYYKLELFIFIYLKSRLKELLMGKIIFMTFLMTNLYSKRHHFSLTFHKNFAIWSS